MEESDDLLSLLRAKEDRGVWDRKAETVISWYLSTYYGHYTQEELEGLLSEIHEMAESVLPEPLWEIGDMYVDEDSCSTEWIRSA